MQRSRRHAKQSAEWLQRQASETLRISSRETVPPLSVGSMAVRFLIRLFTSSKQRGYMTERDRPQGEPGSGTDQDYPRPLGAPPHDAPSPLVVHAANIDQPRDVARYYAVRILDAESIRDAALLAYLTARRHAQHNSEWVPADVQNEGHAWQRYVTASADLGEWRSRWLAEFNHL